MSKQWVRTYDCREAIDAYCQWPSERRTLKRDRPVLRGFVAAGLSWMFLVGAITLGMIVPQQEVLSGFGLDGKLDYSDYDSGFSPLSFEFIADILGLEEPRVPVARGSNEGANATTASLVSPRTSSEIAAAPIDVEHPFTNDDVNSAYKVSSLPFRARSDTSEGTRSLDEPADCFPAGGTAWYRYRPTTDVALFSDTFGTPRATALGVYSRSTSGGLELIGCNKNALGNAQVGFHAESRRTYYFQVTSMVRGGPTIFELAPVGRTTVASLSPSGRPADGPAFDHPDISADGRFVVFTSFARNLTPRPPECGSHPNCESVYLRDRVTRRTSLVATMGVRNPNKDGASPLFPSISADGRYVGFAAFSGVRQRDFEGYPAPPKAQRPGWNAYLYDRVTERIKLISRNSRGEPAQRDPVRGANFRGSSGPSLSADGRYAVFTSDGANMGAPVEPLEMNVYRRDRVTGVTRLVSTDARGRPNRADNCAISGRNVSGDGRYVVYRSTYRSTYSVSQNASLAGRGSDLRATLVYLWDARTGRSRLVSKVPRDREPLGSYCPSISLDGSRVGLVSLDPLVPEDTNEAPDVYAYEVATGRIQRISVSSTGRQTHDPNYIGRESGALGRAVNLSADGRFAVFDSAAPGLAPSAVGSTEHPPNTTQVYLHDILTGATILVSVSSRGEPLAGDSRMPYIAADGSAVAFMNTGTSGAERVIVHELSPFR